MEKIYRPDIENAAGANAAAQNGYMPEGMRQEEQKRSYTPASRWLLLLAIILGALFSLWLWRENEPSGFIPAYAVFWGVYLIGFYALTWEESSRSKDGWFLAAVVVLLFLRYAIYKSATLAWINFAVIPALLMLHMLVCTLGARIPRGLEGQYLRLFFLGWFTYPFKCIARPFGAFASLIKGCSSSGRKNALIGILFAIPLLIVVISLLLSADSVMGYYAGRLFEGVDISTFLGRFALALVVAILFYSFIYSAMYQPATVRTQAISKHLPEVSAYIIIGLLLAVYAVFAYFQFAYLTGIMGLPAELTYSEYAVSGFSQLCTVAAINLALYVTVLTLTPDGKGVKILLALLLLATCVVLYSGIMRLSMYIGAYGLTMNRILPMWFMLFLCFTVIACFVRLFLPQMQLVRVCAIVLVVWYLALSAVNLDAVIARSVLERASAAGELTSEDTYFLANSVSEDAASVIDASPYAQKIAKFKQDGR